MQRRTELAEAPLPGGGTMSLVHEAGHYVVYSNGFVLMSSAMRGSEATMADLACARLRHQPGVRVAVGGLGMGYTLRAALDSLGPDASVSVVEFVPALVEWNQGVLGDLAGHPLDDPRVTVEMIDFVQWLRGRPPAFDAILLDIDNGPEAFTVPANGWLYTPQGLDAFRTALRPGGALVVWSAFASPSFERRLRKAGFATEAVSLRARADAHKGAHHMLYIGRRPR